jgi:hypothetical protein
MTAELVRLALRAVIAAVPTWTLWLSLTSFIVVAGTLLLFYERSRRRTYATLLEVVQPGTLLLDRAHHHKEITIVRLPQPWHIAHSRPGDGESLKR